MVYDSPYSFHKQCFFCNLFLKICFQVNNHPLAWEVANFSWNVLLSELIYYMIPYHTIPYDTLRYHTIQYDTIPTLVVFVDVFIWYSCQVFSMIEFVRSVCYVEFLNLNVLSVTQDNIVRVNFKVLFLRKHLNTLLCCLTCWSVNRLVYDAAGRLHMIDGSFTGP